MSCVSSVVRIGPMSQDNLSASLLRNALLNHFSTIERNDKNNEAAAATATATATEPCIITQEESIVVSNKYFRAKVVLQSIVDEPVLNDNKDVEDPTQNQHKEDGLILVFNDDSNPVCSFDALNAIHSSAEESGVGDLLRLCVGVTMGTNPALDSSTTTTTTKEYEKEYARRILWCLDRGYEYVLADLSQQGLQEANHEERDKDGFARIVEAVGGTVWSSAIMTSAKTRELQASYAETKIATQQEQQDDDQEDEDRPTYEPPDPSLFKMPEVSVGQDNDEEREAKARQAILEQSGLEEETCSEQQPEKGQENVDPTTESPTATSSQEDDDDVVEQQQQQQQERMFDNFEGALRQARTIREMSRSGSLSDVDRRQRAGDAAVLLMDLMDKMGFDESGSDNDDDTVEAEVAEQKA